MHRRTIASLSGILRMHHFYVVIWLFGVDIWRRDINPKNSPLYVVICLLKVDMWRDIIRCEEDWLCMSSEVVCCTVSHHQKVVQAGAYMWVIWVLQKSVNCYPWLTDLTCWPTMHCIAMRYQDWPRWVCAGRCHCIFCTSGEVRASPWGASGERFT